MADVSLGPIDRDVDGRRRISLGKIGNPEHTRYRIQCHPDGSLTLRPVVSVLVADQAQDEGPP